MAIHVITYKNNAEVIRVDKTNYLSNRADMTNFIKFEGEQNILSPTFYINSVTEPDFNYVHIPEFNRYYFVTSKQWISNSMWFVTLGVDVLFSHKDAIKTLNGIASRLEDQGEYSMIIDNRITAEATQYSDIEFHAMDVVEGYTGFDIQTDATKKRTVISCFSGSEAPASVGGPNTMTIMRDGLERAYAPAFDRNYETEDGAYQAQGAGNYTIVIRGTAMQAPSAWGIDNLLVSGSDTSVTISNVQVTQSSTLHIQINTAQASYEYRIEFTVEEGTSNV